MLQISLCAGMVQAISGAAGWRSGGVVRPPWVGRVHFKRKNKKMKLLGQIQGNLIRGLEL